ncbi:MAG: LptF/LptG family permease [Saprospiraceae bacterium]|nr:LptF/LptG family permease [Saprospiraceae bacterium]
MIWKKLDMMLVKGFIPPFILSFLIAMFVLVMQTLWLYIDDIIGKGAGFWIIVEFLLYLSFSMIPWALPIGVLLAGVFQFGNLGERYELSSMKSAGISLLRIMRPLILFAALVTIFSFLCSEYLIPRSNLQFLSRLHDLKKQKPTLSLQEGVFNEDFYGYVIRIGKKASNGKDISDILIYDHSSQDATGERTFISASEGSMYITRKNKFLVMKLENGAIYQQPAGGSSQRNQEAFIRTQFATLFKVFDLKEFNLDRTDEELFKGNQKMKNSVQLRRDIDSLNNELGKNLSPIVGHFVLSKISKNDKKEVRDTSKARSRVQQLSDEFVRNQSDTALLKKLTSQWQSRPDSIMKSMSEAALSNLNDLKSRKNAYDTNLKSINQKKAKYIFELYTKYSYAFVCLLFIFVGAPLGAIVRKGGYGYPLLLCIVVFVVFILMNTLCKRLSEALTIDALLAAWIPCLVMLPPGILLTWSAVRDRNIWRDLRLWIKSKLSKS